MARRPKSTAALSRRIRSARAAQSTAPWTDAAIRSASAGACRTKRARRSTTCSSSSSVTATACVRPASEGRRTRRVAPRPGRLLSKRSLVRCDTGHLLDRKRSQTSVGPDRNEYTLPMVDLRLSLGAPRDRSARQAHARVHLVSRTLSGHRSASWATDVTVEEAHDVSAGGSGPSAREGGVSRSRTPGRGGERQASRRWR